MQKTRYRETAIHISAAAIFLLLPLIFAPQTVGLEQLIHNQHAKRDILSTAFMLLFFYANYFFIIPRFYFQKKYVPFIVFAFIFLLSITLLPPTLFPFRHHPKGGGGPPPPEHMNGIRHVFFEMGHRFFLFAATLLLSLTIKINARWRKSEKEKLNAELSYLKAQINPHFLFNTLNSIYSLSIIKSDKTPEAVVKLSGMMRYVLSESHKERVSLEKEIAYISDYIELQKIRLGNTVKLTYSIQGNMPGKEIAPLVLIPFVENAFKHGVNSEENSEIFVELRSEANYFWLEVTNNKVTSNIGIEEKSGLGIENTKNRLNLLYPNKHELIIRDENKMFTVILKIFF